MGGTKALLSGENYRKNHLKKRVSWALMEKVQQTDGKTIYNNDNKKHLQAMIKQQNAQWVLKDKT